MQKVTLVAFATAAWLAVTGVTAHARIFSGVLPWIPNAGDPPNPVRLGPWMFFSAPEAAAVGEVDQRRERAGAVLVLLRQHAADLLEQLVVAQAQLCAVTCRGIGDVCR